MIPRILRSSLLTALLCIGGLGVLVVGCDSSGPNGDDPEPTPNQAPEASISLDDRSGLTAAFSAAGSTDPDGNVVSYEWDFGDGTTDSTETVVHEFGDDGTYTVGLTVEDDSGATTSTEMDVMVSRTPTTFDVTIENVSSPKPLTKAGVFNTPVGANEPGPLGPGQAYEFSFTVGPNEIPGSGMKLSFASMFVQSNDLFYGFQPGGIELFDEGNDSETDRDNTPRFQDGPVSVTDQVGYWDAGTEGDQEPGTGDDQAPRQSAPDTGPDGEGTLVEVVDSDDDGRPDDGNVSYPPVAEGIDVTIDSEMDDATGAVQFTVRIENVGGGQQVNGAPLVISPGVFAAHFDQVPGADAPEVAFFVPDAAESESIDGIEEIAEDGDPSVRAEAAAGITGPTVPLSPGAFASHSDEAQVFDTGESASDGVERIAEDGLPGPLGNALGSVDGVRTAGVFNSPDGTDATGPLAPGNSYSFSVEGQPGDRLSFVTMYIQSNDLFYGVQPEGLPLFTNDAPINGAMTEEVVLYDAGTEVDQEPGTGLDQAPRQFNPNGDNADVGAAENGTITPVGQADDDRFLDDDGFNYEETANILRVTVTPQN